MKYIGILECAEPFCLGTLLFKSNKTNYNYVTFLKCSNITFSLPTFFMQ